MQRNWHDKAATLWLAPLMATIPLIPIMSIRSSPFFIGRLMDDPTHPVNWPATGPLISAAGVVFDAEILGILFVLFLVAPVYWGLRQSGKNSARNILIVCGGAGILASQIARMITWPPSGGSARFRELGGFAHSGPTLRAGGRSLHRDFRESSHGAPLDLLYTASGVVYLHGRHNVVRRSLARSVMA
jgi:hypothetical protein